MNNNNTNVIIINNIFKWVTCNSNMLYLNCKPKTVSEHSNLFVTNLNGD